MKRRVLTRAQQRACVRIAAEANRLRGRAPRGAVLVVALDFEGCPFVQGPPGTPDCREASTRPAMRYGDIIIVHDYGQPGDRAAAERAGVVSVTSGRRVVTAPLPHSNCGIIMPAN